MLKVMRVLDLTKEAAEIFGKAARQGGQIGDLDTLIASIVLAHGETLVTRDRHFRRVPDLQVTGW